MYRRICVLVVTAICGCALFPSVDGLTGGRPIDAGADAAKTTFSSCADAKASLPSATDGAYRLQVRDAGAFNAYCDMTQDGGGWMLVTPAMLSNESNVQVTTVSTADTNGGAIYRAYANAAGSCGDTLPDNSQFVRIADGFAWTEIRARYTFAGNVDCWTAFGSIKPFAAAAPPYLTNLFAFELGVDTIRDQVRMGGGKGDTFDGVDSVCVSDATNFWHNGTADRSALVILRRLNPAVPAGLGTLTSCNTFASGVTGPTWWEYREIYVR